MSLENNPAGQRVLSVLKAAGPTGLKYAAIWEKVGGAKQALDPILNGLMNGGKVARAGTYYSLVGPGSVPVAQTPPSAPAKDMLVKAADFDDAARPAVAASEPAKRVCRRCNVPKTFSEYYAGEATCKACRKLTADQRALLKKPATAQAPSDTHAAELVNDQSEQRQGISDGSTSLMLPAVAAMHAQVDACGAAHLVIGDAELIIPEERMDRLCAWWASRRVAAVA